MNTHTALTKDQLSKGMHVFWNGNPSVDGGPSYPAGEYEIIDLFARKTYDRPEHVGLALSKGLGIGARVSDLTLI